MSKFKIGDKVRILSDAKKLFRNGRTVVDVYKVKSAVGCIGNICNDMHSCYFVKDLPDARYDNAPRGTGRWAYDEDQLELVADPELPTVESITVKVEIDGEGVNRIIGGDDCIFLRAN